MPNRFDGPNDHRNGFIIIRKQGIFIEYAVKGTQVWEKVYTEGTYDTTLFEKVVTEFPNEEKSLEYVFQNLRVRGGR